MQDEHGLNLAKREIPTAREIQQQQECPTCGDGDMRCKVRSVDKPVQTATLSLGDDGMEITVDEGNKQPVIPEPPEYDPADVAFRRDAPVVELDPVPLHDAREADGYWYLASPYSKYPGGTAEAFEEVCRAAGWLILRGVVVYAPISHTHPIAVESEIDLADHSIWLPADKPLMDGACGLIVCEMETWRDSYGVQEEIKVFMEACKPVYGMRWPR